MDQRDSTLQAALKRLQDRINRGEIDRPEERIRQLLRSFGVTDSRIVQEIIEKSREYTK